MTMPSTPTPSCCGARTWPRCTPSCGPHHRPAPDGQARQDACAVHLHAPLLRTGRQQLIFKPQSDLAILNYICNYIIQRCGERGLRQKHVLLPQGRDRHRLRPAPNHPLEGRRQQRLPGADGKPKGRDDATRRPSASTNSSSSPNTPWTRRMKSPGAEDGSKRWPRPMPTPRPRSCPSGPWASTSTPAAPGSTT